MLVLISAFLACALYIVSASVQLAGLHRNIPSKRTLVITGGVIAVIAHTYFSWHQVFTGKGIDMGLWPMGSVICLAIAAVILLSSMRRPVENLIIVMFPLAAVIIICTLLLPSPYTPRTDLPDGIVAHIFLSVIAYSLLTVAAFQAMLLSFGDYMLKNRSLAVLRNLPPIQTMEGLLFELLWLGLVFLSLSIVTGFVFLEEDYRDAAIPGLIHHAVITLAAWIVFTILLWGRHRLGWRGAVASRWTLVGFVLLAIGYFGSKFVLEMILGRA